MKAKFKKSSIDIGGDISIYSGGDEINITLNKLALAKSGVYCLRNKLHPERYYIGMARNLEKRKWRHYNDLFMGIHHSKLLQEDFNMAHESRLEEFACTSKYTFETDFEMEVIIYCRPSELTFYENILINSLNPYYNIHKQKQSEEAEPNEFGELPE